MGKLKDTYELIHRLNKYEKIQLNLSINAFGKKSKERYLIDYQIFETHIAFDKTTIKLDLLDAFPRKNLTESITNFYNFICDCLISINQNSNKKLGLLNEIQKSEILFSKGLIKQSFAIHKKAKDLSLKIGNDSLQFDLLQNEDRFLRNLPEIVNRNEQRKILIDEQLAHLKKMTFRLELTKLKRELFELAGKIGTPRTKEDLNKYLVLSEKEILKTSIKSIPKPSIYDFFEVKILLSTVINVLTPMKSYSLIQEGLKQIRVHFNKKINPAPEFYLTMYSLEIAVLGKLDHLVEKNITALKKLNPFLTTQIQQTMVETKIHWSYLLHYLYAGKHKLGYSYLTLNKKHIISKENTRLSAYNYLNFLSSARLCFLAEDYKQSLEFIDLLLNKKKLIRSVLLPHIYCLNLLNHYKLNNLEYLPYAIKSLYRSILKEQKLYAPENALLSFLRKSVNVLKVKFEMKKLYKKFKELSQSKYHISFFVNGDYLKWLEKEL